MTTTPGPPPVPVTPVRSGVTRTPDSAKRGPATPNTQVAGPLGTPGVGHDTGHLTGPPIIVGLPGTPASTTPRTRTTTQKRPWWTAHPPALVAVALLVVVAELVAYQLLHLTWWLIANMAAGVLVFIGALAWRYKGRGRSGSRPGLFSRRHPGGVGPSSRPSPGGRGPFGRMFGGDRQPRGAGATGTPPSRRPSLFDRFTGRTKPSVGPGSAPAAKKPGHSWWPFNRSHPDSGRNPRASGGGGKSPSGRSWWPFGRSNDSKPGKSKSPKGGGKGSPSSGGISWWPFKKSGDSPKASTSGKQPSAKFKNAAAKIPAMAKQVPNLAKRFRGLFTPKDDQAAAGADTTKTSATEPNADDKASAPDTKPATTKVARPEPAKPIAVPTPGRHQAPNERSAALTAVQHNDDSSLQRWGRNLRLLGPAIQEVANQDAATARAGVEATAAIKKITQQGDTDLPASKVLTAEMESIASEMQKLNNEAEAIAARRRALVTRAEALPATYKREHETDEDRVNAPRKSRAAERRADVSAAEQDT